MQFREEQNAFDHFLLLFVGFSECVAIHMHMKSACIGHVRLIAQPNRFVQHILPVHIVHMVSKRHRVSDDLKAVIKAAVRFDIDIFAAGIRLRFDAACIVFILTAEINFKLDTKETGALSIEDRLRFETVLPGVC